jgi:hypothetical protein
MPSQLWSDPPGEARPAALPDELLEGAVARVRLLCFLLAAVSLLYEALDVASAIGLLPLPDEIPDAKLGRRALGFHAVAALGVIASATMYLFTRRRAAAPQRVVSIALGFQVLGALLVAVGERMNPWMPNAGISAVCLWIMTFPFIPSTPRRAAVTAYVAASMGPAGLLIGAAVRRAELPAIETMVFLFLANYLAATFALAGSIVIYRLGTDVVRARRLGSYRLVERLGVGGMGEVWRARHRALIRPAAIKLVRAEVLGGSRAEVRAIEERFRREVQATAEMQSPHTITIYDFGATPNGTLYYVMELLRGLDCEVMVRRFGAQPAERVIHLLLQTCHSLAEAHERGLIHRDIKPSNVHACVLGLDYDFVKVLDFGLVKHQRSPDAMVSLPGLMVGTPAYMAPETAAGDPIDARLDLYTLGCVAFWLLTGQMVFGEKLPVLMVADHLRTPPRAPSTVSKLPVPPELDAIVLACLAKDPAGRPASATELARRLTAVPIATPWTQERARAWWLEHSPGSTQRQPARDDPEEDDDT